MDEVEQRIMRFVMGEYFSSFEEGVEYFRMQVVAYHELEAFNPPDIPQPTLRQIKRRAAARDGDDYIGRKQTVEQEVIAYRLLRGDEDTDIPPKLRKIMRQIAKLEAGAGSGYRAQSIQYRRQIAAYQEREKRRDSGLLEEDLNRV